MKPKLLPRIFQYLLILMAIIACSASLKAATLTDITEGLSGARVLGIGEAGLACGLGLQAVLNNPAALVVQTKTSEKSTMSGTWIDQYGGDLQRFHVGYSFNLLGLTAALSYAGELIDGVPETIWSDERPVVVGSLGSRKNIYVGTLATPLGANLTLGASLDYHNYQIYDLIGTGLGWDLGCNFKCFILNSKLNLAASVKNVGSTPISWSNGSTDAIPALYRLGSALETNFFDKPLQFSVDAWSYLDGRQATDWHYGLEYQLFDLGGVSLLPRAGVSAGRITAGLGLVNQDFSIDYAFMNHEYLGNVHRVTLAVDI